MSEIKYLQFGDDHTNITLGKRGSDSISISACCDGGYSLMDDVEISIAEIMSKLDLTTPREQELEARVKELETMVELDLMKLINKSLGGEE